MKSLFPEFEESSLATLQVCGSQSRSWCDPSQYGEVVGIDFGCNSVHYYMARSRRHGKMAFGDLFSWLFRLPAGTLVVCEWAHLGVPQTSLSLAQPFTADQLLCLYDGLHSRDITLKLAPHAHTGKRMRLWVSFHHPEIMRTAEKNDAADALSVAVYVDRCNDVSLANPPKTFLRSPRRDFGRFVTRLSNSVLNAERTDEYRGTFYPLIVNLARKVKRRGGFPNLKFVVTVASTLVGEKDGRLVVFTYLGKQPGRRFWMREVIRMSPWHHRGGIARSNLMWHAFRPYLQRHAKRRGVSVKAGNAYKKFAFHSDCQRAARTSAMKSFRELLMRCRELCLKEAVSMGAGELDLSHVTKEATHGTHAG